MSNRPPFHRHLKYDFDKKCYVDEDGAFYQKIEETDQPSELGAEKGTGAQETGVSRTETDQPDERRYSCQAIEGRTDANDPQDCGWPTCGCDSKANRVIEALEESGHLQQPNEKSLHIITSTGCSICGTDALHCRFWNTYRQPEREVSALSEIKAMLLEGVDLVGGYSCLHPVMEKVIARINEIEAESSDSAKSNVGKSDD